MDSRHPRGEETVKMKWPRRGVAVKQAVARSMDKRSARRMLSVKLGQTRREEQVKVNYILFKERLRNRGGHSALRRQSQSLLGLLDLAGKAARLVV